MRRIDYFSGIQKTQHIRLTIRYYKMIIVNDDKDNKKHSALQYMPVDWFTMKSRSSMLHTLPIWDLIYVNLKLFENCNKVL